MAAAMWGEGEIVPRGDRHLHLSLTEAHLLRWLQFPQKDPRLNVIQKAGREAVETNG